jgi:hypothetical protein
MSDQLVDRTVAHCPWDTVWMGLAPAAPEATQ